LSGDCGNLSDQDGSHDESSEFEYELQAVIVLSVLTIVILVSCCIVAYQWL